MENDFKNRIEQLIRTKKEDDFYDFKQEWHTNNVALVRDIICLANCRYKGDRYLIIGVDDNFNIKGLDKNSQLKKQNDIISILRDYNFAGKNFPSISLKKIEIENKLLQIIIIEDKPEKPYYLDKPKTATTTKSEYIYPGTVYTRNRDTNTPKNETAGLNDVEHMWKERFGLSLSVKDKFKMYLQYPNDWKLVSLFKNINSDDHLEKYFYSTDPAATFYDLYFEEKNEESDNWYWFAYIKNGRSDHPQYLDYKKESKLPSYLLTLEYFGSPIYQSVILNFYNEGLIISSPDLMAKNDFGKFYFRGNGHNVLHYYYYNLENIPAYITYYLMYNRYKERKYTFKEFITNKFSISCCDGSTSEQGYIALPLIFFKNKAECNDFLDTLVDKHDFFNDYLSKYKIKSHPYVENENNFPAMYKDHYYWAMFAYWAYDIYHDHYKNKLD